MVVRFRAEPVNSIIEFTISSYMFTFMHACATIRENERKGEVHRQEFAAGVLAFRHKEAFKKVRFSVRMVFLEMLGQMRQTTNPP